MAQGSPTNVEDSGPKVEDLAATESPAETPPSPPVERALGLEENREHTRGDLARGLLWLLAFSIGGVLLFIGTSRIEGAVLTQSVLPSLIALAGTAVGFYFGAQSARGNGDTTRPSRGVPPALEARAPRRE